jgi:hypothetical protein
MRKRFQQGAILIFALLLSALLLVLGAGFIAQRSLEYGAVSEVQDRAQARQLALAGMEDARVKMEKDPFFPPVGGFGQTTFTYSEDVLDPDDGDMIGIFTVTVNVGRKEEPFRVIRIQSIGSVVEARSPDTPVRASYRIYGEVDVASLERGGAPGVENPRLFRYIDWKEQDVSRPTVFGEMSE